MHKVKVVLFAGVAYIAAIGIALTDTPLVIRNNPGGLVSVFYQQLQQVEASGRSVEVRGRCASACTMILNYSRVCVAPGASFMFHQAYDAPYGLNGPHIINRQVSDLIMSLYPARVQAWINSHGGLKPTPLVMNAYQAWSVGIPRCHHG